MLPRLPAMADLAKRLRRSAGVHVELKRTRVWSTLCRIESIGPYMHVHIAPSVASDLEDHGT